LQCRTARFAEYDPRIALQKEEAVVPNCQECENELDLEVDELEEGDVVACDECGTEYEVVSVEPLELARISTDEDEEEEPFEEKEEEE
jgi:alpha-aminoadipate carrier protein LysW